VIDVATWVWAVLIIAIVAAILGFGGIFAVAAGVLKVIFWVALILFVVGLFMGRRTVA
jgi:uncharacterized membrane protein YtjA (UPF0391 family)